MNSTKFYEAFTALILIKMGFINKAYSDSWLQDRPDLQIEDLGIEVTNAISTNEGEQRFFQQKILGCKTVADANSNSVTKTSKNKNKIKTIDGTPYFYVSTGLKPCNEEETSNHIINQIQAKHMKFQNYPNQNRFSEKWLFVFAEDIFSDIFPLNFKSIRCEVDKSIFDRVFILLNHYLIDIKKCSDKDEKVPLDEEAYLEMSVEASRIIGSPDLKEKANSLKKYKNLKHGI